MRHISDFIAASLTQGAARLCHVWLIERRDGVVMGFCDHDRELVFLGHPCPPQSALTQGAAEQYLGLDSTSNAAISGVISSDVIDAYDIRAGLYDDARLSAYRVDWSDPSQYVALGTYYLARLEVRGGIDDGKGEFIAHVEGLGARLSRTIGRRFTHLCDAALGDARCGLSGDAIVGRTCDKAYDTCLNTFANTHNFRGFPDLPGEDFLTLYPRAGDVLDGGSRSDRRAG